VFQSLDTSAVEVNAITHFIILVEMQVNAIGLPHFLAVISATLKHLCGTKENDSIFSWKHEGVW